MTGNELKAFTESIIEDNVDDTLFYQLLTIANAKLETERNWQYLKSIDETQTAGSGDTYLSMKTLPADFAVDLKLYIGTDIFAPIQIELRRAFKDDYGYYYVDIANSQFALCGKNSGTITLVYKKFAPAIAASTSPVFPDRFHGILGFMTAGYIQTGVDADDLAARMGQANQMAYRELKQAMVMWDDTLANRAVNGMAAIQSSASDPDILARM